MSCRFTKNCLFLDYRDGYCQHHHAKINAAQANREVAYSRPAPIMIFHPVRPPVKPKPVIYQLASLPSFADRRAAQKRKAIILLLRRFRVKDVIRLVKLSRPTVIYLRSLIAPYIPLCNCGKRGSHQGICTAGRSTLPTLPFYVPLDTPIEPTYPESVQ